MTTETMTTETMTTEAKTLRIEVHQKLHPSIYPSEGGGRDLVVRTYPLTVEGLRNASDHAFDLRWRNHASYGLGGGDTWLEIGGRVVDVHVPPRDDDQLADWLDRAGLAPAEAAALRASRPRRLGDGEPVVVVSTASGEPTYTVTKSVDEAWKAVTREVRKHADPVLTERILGRYVDRYPFDAFDEKSLDEKAMSLFFAEHGDALDWTIRVISWSDARKEISAIKDERLSYQCEDRLSAAYSEAFASRPAM